MPTWKSTAAAPTPYSEGPDWLPSAVTSPPPPSMPWQEEQLARNSSSPRAISSSPKVSPACAEVGASDGVAQARGQQAGEQDDGQRERVAAVPHDCVHVGSDQL